MAGQHKVQTNHKQSCKLSVLSTVQYYHYNINIITFNIIKILQYSKLVVKLFLNYTFKFYKYWLRIILKHLLIRLEIF